jgi:hypothetical protein
LLPKRSRRFFSAGIIALVLARLSFPLRCFRPSALDTCSINLAIEGLQDLAKSRAQHAPTQTMVFTKFQRGPDFENPTARSEGFRYKSLGGSDGVWSAPAPPGADHAYEQYCISYDELGNEHVDVYYYDANGNIIHY